MLARKLFLKETGKVFGLTKKPLFGFFSNDKGKEQTMDKTVNEGEAEEKDNGKGVKLAKLSEDELNVPRLSLSTLLKSLEIYQESDKRAFDKLTGEVKTLHGEKEHIPSLKNELKALEDIGKINKEKLNQVIERAKQSEEEATRIETRLTKEIEKAKMFAISKFSQEILEILDNLDLCIDNCIKDQEANKVVMKSDFFQGVTLTQKSALSVFRRFGVTPIEEGVGSPMDPNIHDVMFVAPMPDKPDNEVMYVAKKGYMIGERVLRASKVGVVKNN